MLKYIAKRLFMLIPVILGISFMIYVVLSISPGDPASIILGTEATPEQLAEKRAELGIDKPVLVQYFNYMLKAVRGDFGTSWFMGFDVMQEFSHRLPYTFTLAVIAIVVSVVIGIPLGSIAAVRHNSILDYVTTFFSLLLASAPMFWLGMMMQLLFALKLGWLPASGMTGAASFVLPVLSLAAGRIASNTRTTRTWLLDVIRSDYVRTARAKGAKESRVIMKHALRNALLPVITTIGTYLSVAIGGSVVVETVYSFPGIGSYLINAVKTKDIPIVMGSIIVVSIFVGLINLLVDLAYAAIDPRVKFGK